MFNGWINPVKVAVSVELGIAHICIILIAFCGVTYFTFTSASRLRNKYRISTIQSIHNFIILFVRCSLLHFLSVCVTRVVNLNMISGSKSLHCVLLYESLFSKLFAFITRDRNGLPIKCMFGNKKAHSRHTFTSTLNVCVFVLSPYVFVM